MSPLRGSLMVANVFYTDATPTRFYLFRCYRCFYTDATHTRFYLFRCYRCFYTDATHTRFCYGSHGFYRDVTPTGFDFCVGYVSTEMSPLWGLTFVWLRFYTDVAPTGLDFCVGYVSTEMSPLRGWFCGRRGVSTQMLKKYAEIRRNAQANTPSKNTLRGWMFADGNSDI